MKNINVPPPPFLERKRKRGFYGGVGLESVSTGKIDLRYLFPFLLYRLFLYNIIGDLPRFILLEQISRRTIRKRISKGMYGYRI